MKILLVEDDRLVRAMLLSTLLDMGHEVLVATNGKEALACQERSPAQVMLTDIVMPEKEGLETIREFRRKHPGVEIIAMSGGGRGNAADYLRVAQGLGAREVLSKPFSHEALAAALARVAAP